jgi:hypothetical protein
MAEITLETARYRFARRILMVDEGHPLALRATPVLNQRGRTAVRTRRYRTNLQRVTDLLPAIPRLTL